MASTSAPYDIIRTQDICAQTGRMLEIGEEHIAALIESPEDEPLVRVAYCLEAWGNGPNLPPGANLFGFWKRTIPESDEQPKQLVSEDELFDLFEQLAFRYLLTLILMRKKKLVFERSKPATSDEQGILIVRQRQRGGEGQLFDVTDPGLDNETIAQATEELGQIMNLDADGVL